MRFNPFQLKVRFIFEYFSSFSFVSIITHVLVHLLGMPKATVPVQIGNSTMPSLSLSVSNTRFVTTPFLMQLIVNAKRKNNNKITIPLLEEGT